MLFDNTESQSEPVYLLRLEQGPLAVSGARLFWIISEGGLTLGRAPDCTISLIDDARLISRVQARVAMVQGKVVWQQLGANPSWVNEVALEKGSHKSLNVNDVIRLDPYVFQVAFRSPSLAAGVIPDDWNPMALPIAHAAASRSLPDFPGEHADNSVDRIFQQTESEALAEGTPGENTLFAEASSIDDLLRSQRLSAVIGNPAAPSVWMDELHARHGFSVSTVSGVESEGAGSKPEVRDEIPSNASCFESRFLEGLGLKDWMIKQAHSVSPDFAYDLGLSYRKAMEGLITLMSARTFLKNQMHAEHTTLVPRDNNPLKSCPNVDDLFVRWFASAEASYLKPTQSVESTVQDLLEQQRAMALALRLVIGRLAESFDPEALISKTDETSGSWDFRKYKSRWEAHVEVYRSIFGNAADPVSALLSDAFRCAFEQYTKGSRS